MGGEAGRRGEQRGTKGTWIKFICRRGWAEEELLLDILRAGMACRVAMTAFALTQPLDLTAHTQRRATGHTRGTFAAEDPLAERPRWCFHPFRFAPSPLVPVAIESGMEGGDDSDGGDAAASLFALGNSYANEAKGEGKSYSSAVECWEKAAALGHAEVGCSSPFAPPHPPRIVRLGQ